MKSQRGYAWRLRLSLLVLVISSLLIVSGSSAEAQTYTWVGGASAPWTTPSNWSPPRNSPTASDVIVFDGFGGVASVSATNLPNQTIGQLLISNNTSVELLASSTVTLTIGGGAGTDLSVAAGSVLTPRQQFGGQTTNLLVASGANAQIFGTVQNVALGTINAVDAGGIRFENGSTFGQNWPNPPFTTAGTLNAIVFASGSTYLEVAATGSPWCLPLPNSKARFDPGSTYQVRPFSSQVLDLDGRTLANLELNTVNFGTSVSASGSNATSIDNVTVTNGTLNLGMTGLFSLRGNISVVSGRTLNFNPSSPASVKLNGTAAQTITISGLLTVSPTQTFDVNNANGVNLGSNVTLPNGVLNFTSGRVSTGANTLAIAATASVTGAGSGTGWVIGNLKRNVPMGGSQTFDIGSVSNYLPVPLQVNGLAATFDLTARMTTPDHPQVAGSAINATKSVNRYWTLTPATTPTMTDFSAVFNFAPSDVDGLANWANFRVAKYNGAWTTLGLGTRTATSTQATGVTSFSDFAVGEVPQCLIQSVLDVGNDQGRQIRILFNRSEHDVPGDGTPIIQYEAYRRIDALPVSSALAGAPKTADRIARAVSSGMISNPEILLAGWDYVGAVPAHGESEYNMIAPTLEDSTCTNLLPDAYSAFFIRAATSAPLTYFDTCIQLGYSVDNLPPACPAPISAVYDAGATHLHWPSNGEADFESYRLYRGNAANFVPGPSNLISTSPDTGYADVGPAGRYYKLSATDLNCNASTFAALTPEGTVAVEDAPTFQFALEGARPNPVTSGIMTVSFVLGSAGPVRLELLDVRGRRVAVRNESSLEVGRHVVNLSGGLKLRSGIYLVRLTQGSLQRTARAVVVE